MFDLERAERAAIAILAALLIAGITFGAWKGASNRIKIRVDRTRGQTHAEDPVGPSLKVDINHASAQELCRLSGVGEILAGRIVEYRSSNGPFASAEDIKKVKGIGKALFDRIKDQIYVE